jgi:hypothetical protein
MTQDAGINSIFLPLPEQPFLPVLFLEIGSMSSRVRLVPRIRTHHRLMPMPSYQKCNLKRPSKLPKGRDNPGSQQVTSKQPNSSDAGARPSHQAMLPYDASLILITLINHHHHHRHYQTHIPKPTNAYHRQIDTRPSPINNIDGGTPLTRCQ